MKLTDAPASVAQADDPGQPKDAPLARRPSVRVISALSAATIQARPVARITAALWAGSLLAALAELALTFVTWGDLKLSDGISSLHIPVAAVAYATLGVLIIRRAANPAGWIMLAEGIGNAFLGLTSLYAVAGVATYPGALRRRSWPARCPSASSPPWSSSSPSCSCSSRPGSCHRHAGARSPRPASCWRV